MRLVARAWWILRLLGGAVVAWWNDNLLRLGASLAFGLGLLTTMLAAGGVFLELQAALNIVWRVPARPGTRIREYLWNRAQALGVVLAIGVLLLVALALGAALSAVIAWLGARVPMLAAGLGVLNMGLALGLNAVLFALLFKVLPDVSLGYRTVAAGGLMTAALFVVGRTFIGLYIGQSGTASSYGAVASVAVLLLWLYYSSQIVLIGAEFTRLHAVAQCRPREARDLEHAASMEWG
jgi:membrane protein